MKRGQSLPNFGVTALPAPTSASAFASRIPSQSAAAAARCWLEELKNRALTFCYEIVDTVSGQVCVTGYSKHVCINHAGQVTRIPDEWATPLRKGLPS